MAGEVRWSSDVDGDVCILNWRRVRSYMYSQAAGLPAWREHQSMVVTRMAMLTASASASARGDSS